jgi:hypothetical protein
VPHIWNFHFGFTAEVPIPAKLVEVLKLFRPQDAKGNSPVFCTASDRPDTHMLRAFQRNEKLTG